MCSFVGLVACVCTLPALPAPDLGARREVRPVPPGVTGPMGSDAGRELVAGEALGAAPHQEQGDGPHDRADGEADGEVDE